MGTLVGTGCRRIGAGDGVVKDPLVLDPLALQNRAIKESVPKRKLRSV
jgi:hypothetical protein